MDAEIEGEDGEYLKIYVSDNTGAEHDLTVEIESAGIPYHKCDAYDNNPSLRTREECERVDQTRRFARWHVYRERGYDTVPPRENPDRLMAALLAINRLDESTFTDYFGELEARLASHYDGSSVELPFPEADPDDPIIYQQDVYLEPDPIEFEPPVLEQFLARFEGEPDSPLESEAAEIAIEELDSLAFDIEAVSDIHVLYNDGRGTEKVEYGADPLEREPDARLEIMAFDVTALHSFQHFVVSHLAYQIRDHFLLMGVKPPVAFRAQGWGTYEGFQCQKFCDLYEDYWSSEATVSSWEPW